MSKILASTIGTFAFGTLAFAGGAHADSAARTHDGFHFQVSGGLGFYNLSSDAGGVEESLGGLTFPGSLLLGGTVGPVVIGGGVVIDYAPSPSYKLNGTEMELADVSQYVVGLGLYADYYLHPDRGGLHGQVFAGWGGVETSSSGNVGGSDPTGLVTYIGAGYDWFFNDQWSYGVMGRLVYAPLDFNNRSYTTVEPGIVAQLTWH
jgi:hypothetical protein